MRSAVLDVPLGPSWARLAVLATTARSLGFSTDRSPDSEMTLCKVKSSSSASLVRRRETPPLLFPWPALRRGGGEKSAGVEDGRVGSRGLVAPPLSSSFPVEAFGSIVCVMLELERFRFLLFVRILFAIFQRGLQVCVVQSSTAGMPCLLLNLPEVAGAATNVRAVDSMRIRHLPW